MTSVSAGHIILTVGSGRPQRGSNPRPPRQESRAVPTELPRSQKQKKHTLKRMQEISYGLKFRSINMMIFCVEFNLNPFSSRTF